MAGQGTGAACSARLQQAATDTTDGSPKQDGAGCLPASHLRRRPPGVRGERGEAGSEASAAAGARGDSGLPADTPARLARGVGSEGEGMSREDRGVPHSAAGRGVWRVRPGMGQGEHTSTWLGCGCWNAGMLAVAGWCRPVRYLQPWPAGERAPRARRRSRAAPAGTSSWHEKPLPHPALAPAVLSRCSSRCATEVRGMDSAGDLRKPPAAKRRAREEQRR